ncbi:beta-sarcoglycan-like [Ptychodera flava]|uniref:beta-sarcoglycan-like n=1 Tax=Ptychodera flava TaxID=63121 RepID=UPI00396A9E4F
MASNFEHTSMRRSMREKSLERRRINKEHNSNFRAGYVHIYEEHLHKTGLRGRKRYLAYILLVLLFLVVIANFIITIVILCVLRIDHTGMETLDFMPSGLLRFVYGGDMGSVHTIDSKIGGYVAQDLELNGDTQPITMQQKIGSLLQGASVSIDGERTKVVAQNMYVRNPETRQNIFDTAYNEDYTMPRDVKNLNVRRAVTSMVTGGSESDLTISAGSVFVRGNEGVHLDGKSVNITADSGIILQTYMNETVIMDGKSGIQLVLSELPVVHGNVAKDDNIDTYKLCVCMPSGRLFRVATPPGEKYGCSKINDVNPCY